MYTTMWKLDGLITSTPFFLSEKNWEIWEIFSLYICVKVGKPWIITFKSCTQIKWKSKCAQDWQKACTKLLPLPNDVKKKPQLKWHLLQGSTHSLSGRYRILGSSVHLTDCSTWQSVIKCVKHAAKGVWGHASPGNILISDLLRLFPVLFWDEIAGVGWPTTKSSHCVWSS